MTVLRFPYQAEQVETSSNSAKEVSHVIQRELVEKSKVDEKAGKSLS
ncbi:MAG: hypothetical protein ACLS36_07475 [Streptococcus sp.]